MIIADCGYPPHYRHRSFHLSLVRYSTIFNIEDRSGCQSISFLFLIVSFPSSSYLSTTYAAITSHFSFSFSYALIPFINFHNLFFCWSYRKLTLAGVGVRIKQIGPIKAKVYSAGVYLDKSSVLSQCKNLHSINEKELLKSKEFENTVN